MCGQRGRQTTTALAVLAAVAIAGGCRATHVAAQRQIEASRAETYSSLSQLSAASSAIVIGTATMQTHVEQLNGNPWTVQAVDVQSVVAGQDPGSSFALRQLGDSSTSVEGSQLLIAGKAYLLFIVPWTLVPGDHTGQWVTVGAPAGEYSYDRSSQTASRLDPESPGLPTSVSLGDVRSVAAGSPPQGIAGRPPPASAAPSGPPSTSPLPTSPGSPPGPGTPTPTTG
jgi:hypothetical protein